MAKGKAFCNPPTPMHGCAAISWRAVRQKLKKGWLCLYGNGRTSNFRNNPDNFNRIFKKKKNITPKDYREHYSTSTGIYI
jgi:hypothetical protein